MTESQKATFAGGCFWCTEALFKELKGVKSVLPGYSGGKRETADYHTVSAGGTDHAESIQIKFDPDKITYEELVEIFFKTHDPTTLNRQGNDVGRQYRSVIFYHDENQKQIAQEVKNKIEEEGFFDDPIVTEITPYKEFFDAEQYHIDYYANNPDQAYCQLVINPKLQKFRKEFKDKLKKDD